jgi:hypothetical protein
MMERLARYEISWLFWTLLLGAPLSCVADFSHAAARTLEGGRQQKPCGKHTVTRVDAHGKQFYFCVFEHRGELAEGVFEYGTSGAVVQSFGCAAELFATLTDQPVPEILERSCPADRRGLPVVIEEAPALDASMGYCGSDGAESFAHQRCWETWHNYSLPTWGALLDDRCSDSMADDLDWQCYDHDPDDGGPYYGIGYCRPYSQTWHQRTARTQLETPYKIEIGREVVASCDGTTVFQAFYKEHSTDPWRRALRFTMYHGGVGIWNFWNPPNDFYDLRYTAESTSGFHRYTGGFRSF